MHFPNLPRLASRSTILVPVMHSSVDEFERLANRIFPTRIAGDGRVRSCSEPGIGGAVDEGEAGVGEVVRAVLVDEIDVRDQRNRCNATMSGEAEGVGETYKSCYQAGKQPDTDPPCSPS